MAVNISMLRIKTPQVIKSEILFMFNLLLKNKKNIKFRKIPIAIRISQEKYDIVSYFNIFSIFFKILL